MRINPRAEAKSVAASRLARKGMPAARAGLFGAAAALLASAALVRYKTARVEHQHPPAGRFVEVDGVRLHYVEQGRSDSPVLVLLHGAGSLTNDFLVGELSTMAAHSYRVIIFDRPGYGYSERPRDRIWGPVTQAELLFTALRQLGIEQATVLGHSWGTLVAAAMAIEEPQFVSGLVLLGGYYFPTARPEAMLNLPAALPVIGDLLRHTVSPLVMRLAWPGMLKLLFAPAPVPEAFSKLPPWLLLRPLHLRATAEETSLIMAAAGSLESRYSELRGPLVIMSGADDRLLSPANHSARLHAQIEGSEYIELPGVGHMLHHAEPERVLEAVRQVSGLQVQRPARPAKTTPSSNGQAGST